MSVTDVETWIYVCDEAALLPDRGVCALVDGQQVAVFRLSATNELVAIGNFDPFSKAQVMSRGIIGDREGVVKVASPVYKQSFDVHTGVCLDDPTVSLPVFPVRLDGHRVQVRASS
ncbi:MAG: nitrite reductase small subunit [Acidimicrobiia bacterium]|nr:nitrite reductase small subunit [Acidimicrobiia bacterium]